MSLKGREMAPLAFRLAKALTDLGSIPVIDFMCTVDEELSILLVSLDDLRELARESGEDVMVNDAEREDYTVRYYSVTIDGVTYTTNKKLPIPAPEVQEHVSV